MSTPLPTPLPLSLRLPISMDLLLCCNPTALHSDPNLVGRPTRSPYLHHRKLTLADGDRPLLLSEEVRLPQSFSTKRATFLPILLWHRWTWTALPTTTPVTIPPLEASQVEDQSVTKAFSSNTSRLKDLLMTPGLVLTPIIRTLTSTAAVPALLRAPSHPHDPARLPPLSKATHLLVNLVGLDSQVAVLTALLVSIIIVS
jgi:hypothetical protein